MASDAGHDQTDAELAALEEKIKDVYLNAYADAAENVTAYFSQFEARDAEQRQAMQEGKITKAEYTQWRETQIARGEGYEKMRDKLAEQYTNANQVAIAYVNDATPSIYSLNRNYSAYEIEAAGANVDFSLWDAGTVRNLLVNNPDVMPNYPEQKAIDRGIDLQYGKDQIQKSVTQGILLGHSVGKIADDLQSRINSMSRTSALRAARTAFTEAECAGRQDEYELASDLGIELEKEWLSTADGLTRETHMEADGQTVGIKDSFIVGSDYLMHPADPTGSPEEVYNCRCTMIAKVKGSTKYQDAERWMKDPETGEREKVSDLTYAEWLDAKKNGMIEDNSLTKDDTGNIIDKENYTDREKDILETLGKTNIAYNEVKKLDSELSYKELMDKLAGGDMTSGSCASLSLAYAGNQLGFDVTDFRGGYSQQFFCNDSNLREIASIDGVNTIWDSASQMLKQVEPGKEYIMIVGSHAAVVKTDGEKAGQNSHYMYLEMQSKFDGQNGWHYFKDECGTVAKTLNWRFDATGREQGYMIEINSLKNASSFQQMLGYINTDAGSQMKGSEGDVK